MNQKRFQELWKILYDKMSSFLDTNIVFHYSNYTDFSSRMLEKCYFYIENKKEPFILCYAVLFELQEIIKKRSRLHKAVIEKIKDPFYSFENNNLISFRNIRDAKKLYERLKKYPYFKAKKILDNQRRFSELKIDKFLQFSVDEKVVPLGAINNELINKIHDYVDNHADCKILASALQLKKQGKVFVFVTADKDFSPNTYSFLKQQFEINYKKEKWEFPELKNLLYEN